MFSPVSHLIVGATIGSGLFGLVIYNEGITPADRLSEKITKIGLSILVGGVLGTSLVLAGRTLHRVAKPIHYAFIVIFIAIKLAVINSHS